MTPQELVAHLKAHSASYEKTAVRYRQEGRDGAGWAFGKAQAYLIAADWLQESLDSELKGK